MPEETKTKESWEQHIKRYAVHHVLAHSYSFYFILLLVGVSLDLIFPIKIFNGSALTLIGLMLLLFASILILWAQKTSRDLKSDNLTKENFCRGPYCYTRSPTHWGLFFLMFGFGIIANAFFIIVTSLISLVVTKIFFLKKEESLLAAKYGTPYLEYKKLIKF